MTELEGVPVKAVTVGLSAEFRYTWKLQTRKAEQNGVNPAGGIKEDFSKSTLGKLLNDEMTKLKQVGFSGVVLVAHKGEVILAKSEGLVAPGSTKRLKPNALFELASLSKPITSTAAMILAQQEKLKLDASIAEYLPAVPENCKVITVRHLMQHQSGIPGDSYGQTNADLATAVRTMLSRGPQRKPGTKHEYWNQGYILLSEIVAKAAGKPFMQVCRELVFEPCGMTGTCFTGDKAPRGFVVSTGTGQLGRPRTCLEHPYGKIELVYQGAGGVVSNVHDLLKFHKALNGNKLLSEKSKAELFAPAGDSKYALGWRVERTSTGEMKQSHGGLVRGFNCVFARYPKSDSCIVVLSNNDAAPSRTVTGVIERILFPAMVSEALKAELAKKCVGEYKDAKGRVLEIAQTALHTTYAIYWTPGNPNGPVSRGYLLQKKSGEIVMHQPGETSKVELGFNADKSKVLSITEPALELKFER